MDAEQTVVVIITSERSLVVAARRECSVKIENEPSG
jgi:hypothetical protein